uniref:Uncharacterized protein n=1 Tax=Caldilinea aerophila TaxID=133453 RepID=A0A7C1FFB0_9CHLR
MLSVYDRYANRVLKDFSLNRGLTPRQVRNTPTHLQDFQRVLQETLGFVLAWPEYAAITPR